MFDLKEEDIAILRKILNENLKENQKVYVSRSTGKNKEYSDIDLAIEGDFDDFKLKNDFEKNLLTIKVNILKIKDTLKDFINIEKDFKLFDTKYENYKNLQLLNKLLKEDESNWLEFKQEYKDIESFAYYMLCLCNSLTDKKERYIIYGIEDKTKNKIGLSDKNLRQLTKENLSNGLENNGFSNQPYINVYNIKEKINNEEKNIVIVEMIPTIINLPYYSAKFIKDPDIEKEDNKKEKNKEKRDIKPNLIYSRTVNGICKLMTVDEIKTMFSLKQNIFSLNDFWKAIEDKENWRIESEIKNKNITTINQNILNMENKNIFSYFYKKNLDFRIEFFVDEEIDYSSVFNKNYIMNSKFLKNKVSFFYKNICIYSTFLISFMIKEKFSFYYFPFIQDYFPFLKQYYVGNDKMAFNDINDFKEKIKNSNDYKLSKLIFLLTKDEMIDENTGKNLLQENNDDIFNIINDFFCKKN